MTVSVRKIHVGLAAALCAASPLLAQTATHTVELRDNSFIPQDISIRVGDTVHWVWVNGFHNVESGVVSGGQGVHDNRFRSGAPSAPPAAFDVRFDAAFLASQPAPGNIYPYYCVVHTFSNMIGSVTVVDCLDHAQCDDGNGCTDDVCNAGSCQHPPNTAACSDGDPCTNGDQCRNAVCTGALIDCNDSNPCTTDVCETGVCRSTAGGNLPCNDGNPCTTTDTCRQGVCVGTPAEVCCLHDVDCDDANQCTDDVCQAGSCTHLPNAADCDDGDPCTDADHCAGGMCAGAEIAGCCEVDADCVPRPCEIVECAESRCVGLPMEGCTPCETADECEDEDECTDGACVNGGCVHTFNTAACDDEDACTVDDTCRAGSCAGTALEGCCLTTTDCEDHDRCTTDSCEDGVCAHGPIAGCTPSDDEHPPGDDDGSAPDEPPAPRADPPGRMCGAVGMMGWCAFGWATGLSWKRRS